jgi:hypothetical protein
MINQEDQQITGVHRFADAAAEGQERLAMTWLENIRVTSGKETFSDIVGKMQPASARATSC